MGEPIRPDESRMLDYVEHYRDLIIKLIHPGSGYVPMVPVSQDGQFQYVRPVTPFNKFMRKVIELAPMDTMPVFFSMDWPSNENYVVLLPTEGTNRPYTTSLFTEGM